MMLDTAAAIDAVKSAGKVGIVGYCMGGSVAFLAACKLDGLSCAVGYYGGAIAKNADLKPKVPTLLHFGDQDQVDPAVRCRFPMWPRTPLEEAGRQSFQKHNRSSLL